MLYFDNSVKVNKRFTAAVMAAALLVSFSACNKTADNRETTFTAETKNTVNPDISEPNQSIGSGALITETTTEKAEETAVSSTEQDQTTAPEETSASKTTAAKKKIGKTTVTDAAKKKYKTRLLGKVTTRIPKITIEGVDTKAINNEIYKKFKYLLTDGKCEYQYYIGKTYVSILIEVTHDWDGDKWEAYLYNISRETGKKMSRKAMLKAIGIKESKFEARAKKGIKKYCKETQITKYMKYDSVLKKGYKKAISKKGLKKAIPYKNAKEKLCFFVADMVHNGGKGHGAVYGTC